MLELIFAICMSFTASGSMDIDPVIHFDGSIARGTADYVIIDVKDDHGSVIWTTGQVQQGTTYDIPNDYVHINIMNGYEPFTVVCRYYENGSFTTSSVSGIYFPEDFAYVYSGGPHYYCTNNF